jgi:hypothetical protein
MIDEEKSDSDKITELDLLLEEMLSDARHISHDLTDGITNTKAASILGFIITIIQILILRDNWYRGPIYVVVWGLGFGIILYYSILLYRKYETLRVRYARFFEIHEKLESM